MAQKRLEGLIAAPFTPLHDDGSLNLGLIPRYRAMLRHNGVRGAFICGSTGEGASLTLSEKMAVAEAWAEDLPDPDAFPVITLVGGTCLADCVELARHARSARLHAVAFMAPYYFKPPDVQALADCCATVAAAVPDMPFYYYHIPALTGVAFPMISLLHAVDGRIPNFAGIKYTEEDFMDFLSCLRFREGAYDMLWGRDECLLPALALGARGGVGSTYNYAAPLYLRILRAFREGDLDTAAALQQQAVDMIALLGKHGGLPTGKAFMRRMGLDCGGFRLPLRNMDTDAYGRFCIDTDRIGFDGLRSVMPD